MFKNRAITVRLNKVNKDRTVENTCQDKSFEKKAEAILHILEGVGSKLLFGLCVYVVLDTHRQVAVAKVINHK